MKGTSKKAYFWMAIIAVSLLLPLHSRAASSMYDDPSSSNSQEDEKDPEKTDAQKDDDENQKKKKKEGIDAVIEEADKIMKEWQAEEAAAVSQSSGSYSGSGQNSSSTPAPDSVSDTSSEMYPSDASRATEPVSELQTETVPESEYASSASAEQPIGELQTETVPESEYASSTPAESTTSVQPEPETTASSGEPTTSPSTPEVAESNDRLPSELPGAEPEASPSSKGTLSEIGDKLVELKDAALEKVGNAVSSVQKTVGDAVDALTGKVNGAIEGVQSAVSDAGKYVSDTAESISKTFTEAYENASSSLKEAASFAKDDLFSSSDTTSSFDQGLTGSEKASLEKALDEVQLTDADLKPLDIDEKTMGPELSSSEPDTDISIPDSEIGELQLEPDWKRVYSPLGKTLSREETVAAIDKYFSKSPLKDQNMGERLVKAAEDNAAITGTYVDPLLSLSIAAHEAADFKAISAANNFGGNKILGNGSWVKNMPEEIRSGLFNGGNSTEYQGFKDIDSYFRYQNYFLSQYPGLQSSVNNNRLPGGYAEDGAWGAGVRSAYNSILNGSRYASTRIPQYSTNRRTGASY